jgi:ABC-2 type transport system ATP-binding protein
LVRARGVSYRYGSGALSVSDVDLEVRPGEIVAVIGPNGAGKSTLLRLMTGRLPPSEGTVERSATRIGADGTATLGYGGEETAHFEPLSGFQNARFFARASGLGRRAAAAAVTEHFELLGLTEQATEPVLTYSYGNRRKLLLIEALAHRPVFIVLDEPTAGFDATSRDAAGRLLDRRREEGAGILMVSHDLDLVRELADRITFLHRGTVVTAARPHELLAEIIGPTTRFEISLDERPTRTIGSFGPDVTVVREGDEVVLDTSRGQAALPDICTALVAAGARISRIAVREPGLAEAFRRITGEDLTDGSRT